MTRIALATLLLLSGLVAGCGAESDREPNPVPADAEVETAGPALDVTAIEAIEQRIGGRLGVAMVDADGALLESYRADERFAMCSTFKLALGGYVLEAADRGEVDLDESLSYGEEDLLEYAPVARENLEEGQMTVIDLAEAAATLSDNTAANLLLERLGGPEALTAFFRSHGDTVTRLDRNEPTLNENAVGDPRDTTTPLAMAELTRRLILGDGLSPDSRQQLTDWAVGNQTGDNRIRAGIPAGWRVGDKTGSCGNAFNDIGIVWPPEGEPFVLTVYMDRPTAESAEIDEAYAELGRLAAAR